MFANVCLFVDSSQSFGQDGLSFKILNMCDHIFARFFTICLIDVRKIRNFLVASFIPVTKSHYTNFGFAAWNSFPLNCFKKLALLHKTSALYSSHLQCLWGPSVILLPPWYVAFSCHSVKSNKVAAMSLWLKLSFQSSRMEQVALLSFVLFPFRTLILHLLSLLLGSLR